MAYDSPYGQLTLQTRLRKPVWYSRNVVEMLVAVLTMGVGSNSRLLGIRSVCVLVKSRSFSLYCVVTRRTRSTAKVTRGEARWDKWGGSRGGVSRQAR